MACGRNWGFYVVPPTEDMRWPLLSPSVRNQGEALLFVNMYVHIYIYIYILLLLLLLLCMIHMCVYKDIYIYIYTHIHTYIYIEIYVCFLFGGRGTQKFRPHCAWASSATLQAGGSRTEVLRVELATGFIVWGLGSRGSGFKGFSC